MNDTDNSQTLSLILMLCAAGVVLPAFMPALREEAVAWLLSYDILLPAAQSVVTIPTTGAGVDLRRILVVAFAVLLAGLVQQMSSGSARKAKR